MLQKFEAAGYFILFAPWRPPNRKK